MTKPSFNFVKYQPVKPIQQAPEETEGRTWGEVATDTGAGLMSGFAQLGGNLTHLADMVLMDAIPDSAHKPFERASEYWQDKQSDELKAAKRNLADAKGVSGTLSALWENPMLISDQIVQSLPSMLPVGAASRVAQASKMISPARAAIATGGVMEAGDAGKQAYEEIMAKTPEELFAHSTHYANLRAEGYDHDESIDKLANKARISSFATTLPIAMIASKVTGAGKAEANIFTGQGIKGIGKTTAGQVAEEAVQEGGNQLGVNVGKTFGNDDQSLLEDVDKMATIGGTIGGVQGGAISTIGSFQREPEKPNDDTLVGYDEEPLGLPYLPEQPLSEKIYTPEEVEQELDDDLDVEAEIAAADEIIKAKTEAPIAQEEVAPQPIEAAVNELPVSDELAEQPIEQQTIEQEEAIEGLTPEESAEVAEVFNKGQNREFAGWVKGRFYRDSEKIKSAMAIAEPKSAEPLPAGIDSTNDVDKEASGALAKQTPKPIEESIATDKEIENKIVDSNIVEQEDIQPKVETPPEHNLKNKDDAKDQEDWGEEIATAKKNIEKNWRATNSEDEILTQPLSKTWPVNTFDDVGNDYARAFAFAARSEIPRKPIRKSAKKAWAGKVTTYMSIVDEYIVKRLSDGTLDEAVIKKAMQSHRLDGFADKVDLLKNLDKKYWPSIKGVKYYPSQKSISQTVVYTKSGNKIIDSVDTKEVAKALPALLDADGLADGSGKAKSYKFEVRRERGGKSFIVKSGDKEYTRLVEFDTPKEALEFKKENQDKLVEVWERHKEQNFVNKADMRNKANRPRTGKDYRKGKDVTAADFESTFGIKRGVFGKWVKKGDERQKMLNGTYDAFMDMANIIGIPPKAIGLEGTLGMAFGASGSGNYSAHYEPDAVVINLTKTKGAGSLAHEWFHALDNYFQKKRGENKNREGGNYVTTVPEDFYVSPKGLALPARRFEQIIAADKDEWQLAKGVRKEVLKSFKNVVDTFNSLAFAERSASLDARSSKKYWSTNLEKAARSFENYIIVKMKADGYNNDFLANVATEEQFAKNKEKYPYLRADEIAEVEAAFDKLFATIESKETDDGGVALFSRGEAESIDEFSKRITEEQGLEDFFLIEKANGDIELANFVVPKVDQKSGKGTAAMQELIKFADSKGKRLVLSPALKDDRKGTTSKSRLIKFYKRFGFVENKGRNKSFEISGTMYREPEAVEFANADSDDITETDNFKKWFAGSKVVDKKGKPLVVYHGTERGGFGEFDEYEVGSNTANASEGFYFTESRVNAATYSGSKQEAEVQQNIGETDEDGYEIEQEDTPSIYSVYLSLKNPLEVDFEGRNWDGTDENGDYTGHESVPEIEQLAHDGGYDGAIIRNIKDEGRHGQGYGWGDVTYIVFKPSDIKSVNNNGDFNPASPEILAKRSSNKPSASVTASDADAVIDSIIANWDGAGRRDEFIVAPTFYDLPNDIKSAATEQGAENSVKGVFHKNKTYLVLDQLKDKADIERVIYHEAYGHYGIRKLFGKDIDSKLKSLFVAIGGAKGISRISNKYNVDLTEYQRGLGAMVAEGKMSSDTRNRIIMDELLAHIQQENKPSLTRKVREILGAIRSWLKSRGFISLSSFSDSELFHLLKKSREAVKGNTKETRIAVSQVPAFSRKETNDPYEALFNSLGDKDKTIKDKAKRELKRWLLPNGNLPKNVFKEKILRDSEFQAAEIEISARIASFRDAVLKGYEKQYKDLDAKTRIEISDYLGGKASSNIPASVKEEIHKMRLEIKGLSKQYAKALDTQINRLREQGKHDEADARSKLLATIRSKYETYVNRSYKAFDDPSWPSRVPKKVVDDALNYLAKGYAGNGDITQAHKQKAARTVELMLEKGTAFDSMESFIAESKLGAKDLKILVKKKDIAPEILKLLGEYKDVEINYAKTVTKMTRLVFNDAFLEKVLEDGLGTFLFTEENRPLDATAQIASDGSKVMEPLNGYYAHPEVAQAFTDILGKANYEGWLGAIIRLNGAVKFGKTVLSPTTAMRNFWSAAFFTFANGHWDITQARKSIGVVRGYFKSKGDSVKYLAKVKRLGVVYDTPYAGEMMKLLEESKIEDALLSKGKLSGFKAIIDAAQKFYQFGDDFWKIIGFENEKAMLMKHKGMSEAAAEIEAAERIRNTFPTYSMTPKFVDSLRRFPLAGTFVSFPAEIIRTSYHIMRYLKADIGTAYGARKATGVMFVGAFAFAAQAVSKSLLGITDEEEEGIKDLVAPWQKNSNLVYLGRNDDGDLRYLDISFLDPYNYWKRPVNAMLRNEPTKDKVISAAKDALSPFFGQDIAFGIVMEAAYNKKSSGGKVFNPKDSAIDQTADIANHLRKGLQPTFINNAERMLSAINGEVSKSGKQYTVGDEVYANLGFRVSTLDPKTSLFYSQYGFSQEKSDTRRILSSIIKDPNEVDEKQIERYAKTAYQSWIGAHNKMLRLIAGARAAGMSEAEIKAVLQDTSISKRDIATMLKGHIPEFKLSKQSLTHALKRMRVIGGDEGVKSAKERFTKINKALGY